MAGLELKDFDAVAFDVEGTLADTIPAHHQARKTAFAAHGYSHITAEQHALGPTYGSSTADIIGGVLHTSGEIDKHGAFKEHAVVRQVMATKTEAFAMMAADGFAEMPGAIAFLHAILDRFDGRTALVTSSPARFVLPFLQRYRLTDKFAEELIITEDTIVAEGLEGKPSPDPYKLAMRRLKSSRMLVFEDTVSGVASAKQAGATVIALAFEPANAALFEGGDLQHPPDYLVYDYAETARLLGIPGGA